MPSARLRGRFFCGTRPSSADAADVLDVKPVGAGFLGASAGEVEAGDAE
jgi:hypothetical protein